jgi:hypothetical protein
VADRNFKTPFFTKRHSIGRPAHRQPRDNSRKPRCLSQNVALLGVQSTLLLLTEAQRFHRAADTSGGSRPPYGVNVRDPPPYPSTAVNEHVWEWYPPVAGTLGAHTDSILAELEYSAADIEALKSQKVVLRSDRMLNIDDPE